MTPDDLKRLEEIEGREKAATPGPWKVCPDETEENAPLVCVGEADEHSALAWRGYTCVTKADAEFIAYAREDIPWLIAKVRELGEEIQIYKNSKKAFKGKEYQFEHFKKRGRTYYRVYPFGHRNNGSLHNHVGPFTDEKAAFDHAKQVVADLGYKLKRKRGHAARSS